jgi:hypothetical protein
MYSDAAVEIIEDLSPLFSIAEEKDRVIFEIPGGHINRTWTKRDTFILLKFDEELQMITAQTLLSIYNHNLELFNHEEILFYQNILPQVEYE